METQGVFIFHKHWIKTKEQIAVLPGKNHKNKKPKVFPLDGKMWEMIRTRLENPSAEGLLFHRNGRRIKSIRRLCKTLCAQAQIDETHFFHNLRRSCRTNLG